MQLIFYQDLILHGIAAHPRFLPTKKRQAFSSLPFWVHDPRLNPDWIERTRTVAGIFRIGVLRLGQQNIEIVHASGTRFGFLE